jgi:hypothetical protein
MISRRPKMALILMVVALSAFAILAASPLRHPVLRAAGRALVANDPVTSADIIVVSLDSDGAGALEAADLVHSGVSKRVAVFIAPPSEKVDEFVRRGVPYEDETAKQIRELKSLGVLDIVRISPVDGTGEGVKALPAWCDEHQLRTIVFVARTDHTRRLRRVLDRIMNGHATRFMVKPARYTNFDPDRWWEKRSGIRTEIVELQKLLFEIVLHPMSF